MTTNAKTLGIYVQVPFCQSKCTYCNFHTGVVAGARFAPYVDAVSREIREWKRFYEDAEIGTAPVSALGVDTAYIGGGTPSLLDPALLAHLMQAIHGTFDDELSEVTLEADPETVTLEKAGAWVDAAINRVSFGVQSFADKELVAAGRMHRRDDVYRAFEILRRAGISNISCDLIAGLPWQTRQSWKESLGELTKLSPEHVSVYLLEVDDGSRLGKELLSGGARYSAGAVPTEDEMAAFYELACEFLQSVGYRHYEISNWAKPGFESRHNLKYWKREPYLGFGAGAHSFSGCERWANVHDAAQYVRGIEAGQLPVEQKESVSREMALEEELFLGLRKLEGIDIAKIEKKYGVELNAKITALTAAGLLRRNGDQVSLAEEKISISNEVFVALMR